MKITTKVGSAKARSSRVRRSKFNNKKTTVDGIQFDSKKEAARYVELKQLLRARKISDLRLQVVYEIVVCGKKICKYKADFVYVENGEEIVEDVKSKATITPVYRLKKKLMAAVFGIKIRET